MLSTGYFVFVSLSKSKELLYIDSVRNRDSHLVSRRVK